MSVSEDLTQVTSYSFRQICQRTNRFANVLSSLGVAKGERALVLVSRQPEWYDIMVGMIKRGVIPMPTTILSSAKDLQYRIQSAQPSVVVSVVECCARVEAIELQCPSIKIKICLNGKRDGWLSFDDLMASASSILAPSRDAPTMLSDPMILFFTSGTTGNPKMVRHCHGYPLAHYITGRYVQDLKPDDVHWTLADSGWAKSAWGCLFPQWLLGVTVVQYRQGKKFDARATLKVIELVKVTTFCAPPTAYRMIVQEDLRAYDLSSLRHCLSAGEPLNPQVIQVWKRGTGLNIYDHYGQTETTAIISNYQGLPVKPGSMGLPTPGNVVEIVDDDGHLVPPLKEGHIAVKVEDNMGVFMGYWNADAATHKVFKHGYYYTLDKAYKDEDGYFWYVGRADDVFKSSGYRIGPFEIESVLVEHNAVLEAAVVGVEDPEGVRGLVIKAFIVLTPSHRPTSALAKELQEHVKKRTAPYKYPRLVEFVAELPKTVSGKIRRAELRTNELQKARGHHHTEAKL